MWIIDRDIWREVFNTLTKNLLRTFLTTLGVLFAVMILILLLGASNGMQNGFNKLFKGTSTNSLFMWASKTGKPYKGFKRGRSFNFVIDDVRLIKDEIKEIQYVVPRISKYPKINYKGQTTDARVYGDFPELDKVFKKNIKKGRFINQNDIDIARKVCVIDDKTQEQLFKKNEDPIGKFININSVYFKVIGVGKPKKGMGVSRGVNIPFTAFQKVFNTGEKVDYMAISIKPNYKVASVLKVIEKNLKKKYKIAPDDERAIGSFDLSEMFNSINGFTLVLKGFSFFIGIFTLLAGVIAISNIMLITVKERTKEIGIRRALGATPKVIKRQILLESIVLTTISALIGFAISVGILYIVDVLLKDGDVPFTNPTVSFTQLISSFLLMMILSLAIGMIPARRAIKIKPIEALRE